MWQDVSFVSPFSEKFNIRKDAGLATANAAIRALFAVALEVDTGVGDLEFHADKGSHYCWHIPHASAAYANEILGKKHQFDNDKQYLMPSPCSTTGSNSTTVIPLTDDCVSVSPSLSFSVGDVVSVCSRTWPGNCYNYHCYCPATTNVLLVLLFQLPHLLRPCHIVT